jgi:hypothetical protein
MILTTCSASDPALSTPLEDGQRLLATPPPTDAIKKNYVPYDAKSVWYIENSFREEQINTKLHECNNVKNDVLTVCQDKPVPPQEPPLFYKSPYFIFAVTFFAGVIGYGMGLSKGAK